MAHRRQLVRELEAFLASGELPEGPALTIPEAPPGAPIGQPDPEWLGPWGEWGYRGLEGTDHVDPWMDEEHDRWSPGGR